jgi:lipoprotein NlpI
LIDYNKAIELDPEYGSAYDSRGDIEKAKGDLDGALADYNKAIELNPKYASTHISRGNVKQAKGDLDGALADYNQALELDPKDARAHKDRGNAKLAKGDFDGALSDYNKAIELSPKYATAYISRGFIKQAKSDLDEARADYARAIELNPKTAWAYYGRGIAKQEQDELDGAVTDFRRYLELEPKAQDYARIQIWLLRMKKGEEVGANEELSIYLDKHTQGNTNDWGLKIVRFFLGRVSEDDLLAAASSDTAKDKGQHCEFWYYTGIRQLLAGDKDKAVDDFHKCLATKQFRFVEYWTARHKLKALGKLADSE